PLTPVDDRCGHLRVGADLGGGLGDLPLDVAVERVHLGPVESDDGDRRVLGVGLHPYELPHVSLLSLGSSVPAVSALLPITCGSAVRAAPHPDGGTPTVGPVCPPKRSPAGAAASRG